eukprot:TRINITY_DN128_c0_g1_i1.p1 TRINITY_DN128_c0_g1~~TRINITY_DN128_c0_g1_i1.p1  ORF type:complete len:336 (+),score=98.43 TRINITY_DN128_c0_g1_i1:2-1009(+)
MEAQAPVVQSIIGEPQPPAVQPGGSAILTARDVESQQQQQQQSFLPSPGLVLATMRVSRPFQLHAAVAAAVSALSVLVWLFVGFAAGWWPWFIYPVGVCMTTLSAHFYVFLRSREWLPLHVMLFGIVNTVLFISWEAGDTFIMWFVYPLIFFMWLLSVHIVFEWYRPHQHFKFMLHCLTAGAIFLILFFVYMDTNRKFPWISCPAFFFGLLLILHYCWEFNIDKFTAHCYIFTTCNIFFFSFWLGFTTDFFPVFTVPLLLWSGGLAFHYYRYVRPARSAIAMQSPVVPSEVVMPPMVPSSYPQAYYAPTYPTVPEAPMITPGVVPAPIYPPGSPQ